MRAHLCIAMLTIPLALSVAGCKNAFEEFANKESDEALLFEAGKLADARQWTEAIAKVAEMSDAGKAKRETKLVLASYYAGRCGLDLLGMAEDVKDGLALGLNLFPILSVAMPGSSVSNANDCETAEETIQSISNTASSRTPDENVVMALIEFAKIGAVLVSSGADANADGTLNTDHTASCALADIPSGQTVSPAQRIGSAITNAAASLAASGSEIGSDAVSEINGLCTTIEGIVGAGFCSQYKPTDFTGNEVKAIASLIQSSEIGYNACGGTVDSAGCICP